MTHAPVYLFCGVGGSGMSALAMLMHGRGAVVLGSDRNYDMGRALESFARLQAAGVQMVPQDGSGVTPDLAALVVSAAVEDSIPDVARAKELGIPILKRANVLADICNRMETLAIAGTSGKSTTTAMLGHILSMTGRDPTVMNGAALLGNAVATQGLGNALIGRGQAMVAEVDESDKSITLYNPAIAILTNISLDHHPIDVIRPLFHDYLARATRGAVVNLDNPEAASLSDVHMQTWTFSLHDPAATFFLRDMTLTATGSRAVVCHGDQQADLSLGIIGRHNLENALAALAAAVMYGVGLQDAAASLASFRGVHRRLEAVGTQNGITVIDDFAHNPDKVAASLAALRQTSGRLIVIFQPHGFGPMRVMGREIMTAFADGLLPDDVLILTDILYLGGTADQTISSADLQVMAQGAGHAQTYHIGARPDILTTLKQRVMTGDRIVIMGARDDTLPVFAKEILQCLNG